MAAVQTWPSECDTWKPRKSEKESGCPKAVLWLLQYAACPGTSVPTQASWTHTIMKIKLSKLRLAFYVISKSFSFKITVLSPRFP